MRELAKAVAGCCLLMGAMAAPALDCKLAATPIEKKICGDAELSRVDGELNRIYAGLRPQLTAKARGDLLEQQRAWLAERNRSCADGEASCLLKMYQGRLDELEALSARASASDQKLDDATAAMVKGKWKATAVQDPAGAGRGDEKALHESLDDANLPAVGESVTASPGKLCLPAQACEAMGWTRTSLAAVNDSEAIARYLGLSPTIRVWVGSSGATQSYYLLVPRGDGTVWAVFGLCGANAQDCRKAAEVWTPASADAAVLPPPHGVAR